MPAGMGFSAEPISSTGSEPACAAVGASEWQSKPSSVVVSPGSILMRPTSSRVDFSRLNVSVPAT